MKEQGATEEEWECVLTMQDFIKMSNTKGQRKKNITIVPKAHQSEVDFLEWEENVSRA